MDYRRYASVLLVPFVLFVPALHGASTDAWVIEDFSDIVTAQDASLNDFSGNMGVINKWDVPYGKLEPAARPDGSRPMQFAWDFSASKDDVAYTGFFLSLFGLSDARATFDGEHVQSIRFDEHTLDLDRIDGRLIEPGGPRAAKDLCALVSYDGDGEVQLRLELKDTRGGSRFTRVALRRTSRPQLICWSFRDPTDYAVQGEDIDLRHVKTLACLIEREHAGDGVHNPTQGALDFHRFWLTPARADRAPETEADLLDLVERRTFQYYLDWASRKPASRGIPQDRSTFGTLLTTGGIGYALPAFVIGAERGWLDRKTAAEHVASVLRILDNDAAYGPEPHGRIGYRGWLYHFVGVDGKRALNFDDPTTVPDERLNTVEISTIDTALALMGVLVAQNYFDGTGRLETEIRERSQSIHDRVDWTFMLDPGSKQFYLGWKPNEKRNGPAFAVRDREGLGCFSGTPQQPATLDYYTDEAMIVGLLALGQERQPLPDQVWTAWKRDRTDNGFVRSYPGSLFTYQQLHAFLDTRNLVEPARDAEPAIYWYENSRRAMMQAIAYASGSDRYRTYGPDAWGFSAAEGPYDTYRAYGIRPLAVDPAPAEDGTISYYAMVSGISYGRDLRRCAVAALRNAFASGHWHPRFGLPDAFNADIAQAGRGGTDAYRQSGAWTQRALFAMDQGPMLLHIENARSGLIWKILSTSPQLVTAVQRVRNQNATIDVAQR
ncbi:MAG TPA: glucoamylase family protein [Kiritimatiellia bacterium]|jgi:hypothetical protein